MTAKCGCRETRSGEQRFTIIHAGAILRRKRKSKRQETEPIGRRLTGYQSNEELSGRYALEWMNWVAFLQSQQEFRNAYTP